MSDMKRHIPNLLSAYRILVVPILMVFFYIGSETAIWINCALFFAACWSDFFDGHIARSRGYSTVFGSFLDTSSDKIMIGCVLMLLIAFGQIQGYWVIPAVILLAREMLITNLRGFLGVYNVTVKSTKSGKYKAFLQMFASGFLMAGPVYGPQLIPYSYQMGQAALALACVLSIHSAWDYTKVGMEVIKKADTEAAKNR